MEIKKLDGLPYKKGNKIFCSLNFDDLCPIQTSKGGRDFGGIPGKGLALVFERFLTEYPHVGVTLFTIPMATLDGSRWWTYLRSMRKYDISAPEHSEWLEYWKSLARRYNIEFALHGFHHVQFENLFFSRYTEFAFKRRLESARAIAEGCAVFHRAGWNAVGFRQPGWDLNSDLSLLDVLGEKGFRYVAGSSYDAGFNARRRRVSDEFPALLGNLINFPQNILLDWELDRAKEAVDRIVRLGGIISIKGHFVDRDDTNCLSERNLRLLRSILDYITITYHGEVVYMTFRQLAMLIGNGLVEKP